MNDRGTRPGLIDIGAFSDQDPALLPDFIGIGVPKSATTWIHAVLKSHPLLYLPDHPVYWNKKEFEFWNERPNGLTTAQYLAAFAEANGRVSGEFSTGYCSSTGTLERIHQALPNVQIIVGFRDPVEALISAYYHQLRNSGNTYSLRDWFDEYWPEHSEVYNYDRILRDLTMFPAENVHVYHYDDVVNAPGQVARELFRFLLPDPGDTQLPTPPPVNSRYMYRSRRAHLLVIELIKARFGKQMMREMVNNKHRRKGWVDFLLKLNEAQDRKISHDTLKYIRDIVYESVPKFIAINRNRIQWGQDL